MEAEGGYTIKTLIKLPLKIILPPVVLTISAITLLAMIAANTATYHLAGHPSVCVSML